MPNKQVDDLPTGPSMDYRATKLLKMGGMPHWQPARRAWDNEEEVSFTEGELTLFWPPKGWKNLNRDQKLLQWEFASLSLLKARGTDIITKERADVLDSFNFLALPGTAPHKLSKSSEQYMLLKSRFFNYETLRAIANGDLRRTLALNAGGLRHDERHLK